MQHKLYYQNQVYLYAFFNLKTAQINQKITPASIYNRGKINYFLLAFLAEL